MLVTPVTATLVGVATHWGVFNRGEWHLWTAEIVLSHIGMLVVPCAISLFAEPRTSLQDVLSNVVLFVCYLSGLLGSMAIYRLFFHRLRHFPGPRMAALTKFWHVYACRDSRNHLVLDELHKKYGDVVRTGPEELSIYHPAAIEMLDGAGNANNRTDWYDIVQPRVSPVFSRDEVSHLERRRIWTMALSTKSIKEYLPRIKRQIRTLDKLIESYDTQPIILNDVMPWFAFDSMGEFAFNQDFNMMQSRTWHGAITQQRSALTLLGPFNCAIWVPRLAFALAPFFWKVKDWFGMVEFCDTRMQVRLKKEPDEPDVAAWFIKEYEKNKTRMSDKARGDLLSGNAVSVIVGGSDTTGPSLILLWVAMARYPEHAQKIYEEIQTVDIEDPEALAKLPHLNGFINETMRLLPAALTGGNRIMPPSGVNFEGTFIPGGTKVAAPKYSIFRSEAAFEEPLSFVPERWYSRPDMIKDKRAFAPFGTGRRACVGKNLALTQIRLVAATLLTKYNVRFAPGEDGSAVERDMRDQVTAQPGICRVIFEPR